jgi:hypothetical protein
VFTQADVDRILGERLARERAQHGDIDALRRKAQQFDELQEAQRSDLEREQQARQEAEQQAQVARDTAQAHLRRASVLAEAATAGAHNPEAVVALLKDRDWKVTVPGQDGQADQNFEVTVGDDGQVTGAREAVKAFLGLDENQYLVGRRQPGPGDGGPRTPAPPEKPLDEQIQEATAAGDWNTVNQLNARKLAELHKKE